MAIEDELKEFEISQPSEMQGVAKELFDDDKDANKIDQKTNLIDEEIGLCMVNDLIFSEIDMQELCPTKQFKRLASSRRGWKTEAFVRTAQANNENKAGLGSKFGDMFKQRQ